MRLRRAIAFFALASRLAFAPSHAFAQGDANYDKAKQLFEEGRKAMSESRYDSACQAFEQSLALARGIGTRFNLADCEQHRGHLTRSRELFLEVADQAREVGQGDRERVARDRAAAIEADMAHLKLDLDGSPTEITIDDRAIKPEAAREPIAVDPGTHRISVSAPEKRAWKKEISVPKAGMYVVVSVPALEDAGEKPNEAKAQPESQSEEDAPKKSTPLPEPDVSPNRGAGARRAALVLGGIGAGALVAGAAFGLQFVSNNHDAKAVCPTSYGCSEDEIALHHKFIDDARRARTWSYVGFGVGAAALAGAGLLYFTLGQSGSVSASTGFNVDGSWNVALRGRY